MKAPSKARNNGLHSRHRRSSAGRKCRPLCAGDKGVNRAGLTKGPYDVVCAVEGETEEALHQVVLNGIQRVAGVTGLYTCFVEEAY